MLVALTRFLGVMKPCVRWPPWGRSRPMMRSWGLSSAVYTAKLAGEPDRVCRTEIHVDRQALEYKTVEAVAEVIT
jgi:hypothetical protein